MFIIFIIYNVLLGSEVHAEAQALPDYSKNVVDEHFKHIVWLLHFKQFDIETLQFMHSILTGWPHVPNQYIYN